MINTYNTLIEKENNFNCVTVDTMEQLQNEIAKYYGKEEYIFRGANEAKFMMLYICATYTFSSRSDLILFGC